MNEHFRYLLDDDVTDFFQKAALDEAAMVASRALSQRAMQKTAAAENVSVLTTVDRDIGILKTAGPVGMELGMLRRADAYLDRLCNEGNLTPEVMATVFDKVAGEAIHTDIEAARAHLYQVYGEVEPSLRSWIDSELAKLAADLVRSAMMEKEAIGPLATLGALGLRGTARGLTSAAGAGISGAARATGRGLATAGRAVGRGATAPFRGAAAAGREGLLKLRTARSVAAAKKLKGIEGGIETARGLKPSAFQAGALKSLERQKANAAGTLAKREQAFQRSTAPAAPKPAPVPTPPPPAAKTTAPAPAATPAAAVPTPPVKEPKVKRQKQPAETPEAQAAKPPDAPAAVEGAAAAAPGEKPKFKETFSKLRDQGWKSLSGEEKQRLINMGALGLVGGRLATGHGVITGGEGLI